MAPWCLGAPGNLGVAVAIGVGAPGGPMQYLLDSNCSDALALRPQIQSGYESYRCWSVNSPGEKRLRPQQWFRQGGEDLSFFHRPWVRATILDSANRITESGQNCNRAVVAANIFSLTVL